MLCLKGYPENSIEQTKPPTKTSNPNTEWSYLKILYISERLNHRITYIFRKENIPARIAHKSSTPRQAISHTSTERNALETNALPLTAPGGGGILPYIGFIGVCRCEGYGFQAVYSRIGYINQRVWV